MLLLNLGRQPLTEYTLDLANGPLTHLSHASLLLGEGQIRLPTPNPKGGFAQYQPLETLPARSSFVIQLNYSN